MSSPTTPWSDEAAERIFATVMQRSTTDAEFRRLCLDDPAAAVRAVAGFDLPPDFHLRVVENEGADLTVVLPDLVAAGELDETQLDEIAGGGGCLIGTCGGTNVCGGITVYCLFTCGGSAISP